MRDVLLDLDLMEDLLELFFVVSVEEIACDSVSGCVMTFIREQNEYVTSSKALHTADFTLPLEKYLC